MTGKRIIGGYGREGVMKHHTSLDVLGAFSLAFGDSLLLGYNDKLPPRLSVVEAKL